MLKRTKRELGIKGEQIACELLQGKGYKIVTRNYRTRLGEIDIIAQLGKELIFVEVKTRTSTVFGSPAEAVDYKKQAKIIHTAQSYMMKQAESLPLRFDIIEVLLVNDTVYCNHIINAFGI